MRHQQYNNLYKQSHRSSRKRSRSVHHIPLFLKLVIFISMLLFSSKNIYIADAAAAAACQSCLVNTMLGNDQTMIMSRYSSHHHHSGLISSVRQRSLASQWKGKTTSVLCYLLWKQFITSQIGYYYHSSSSHALRHSNENDASTQKEEGRSNDNMPPGATDDNPTSNNNQDTAVVTSGMVNSIKFYKSFISPLLPPACRFVPTCSVYGVEAIQKFGPAKGGILTAWRLLRCSPFGGRGYDPPKWPPVSYTYGSY